MSRPDATAAAALDEQVIRPVWLAFLDFDNEPTRVNTSGASIAFSGTGNPDLDGFTFDGISGDVVDIGPVSSSESGTESITATLSGIESLDADMLAEIEDATHWQGRIFQLWRIIRNAENVQQGGVQHFYTGYMTDLEVMGSPEGQVIRVTVEGYVSAFSAPSFRSYLDQTRYDSGDQSARAAIAIANGNGAPMTQGTGIPIRDNPRPGPVRVDL
ncbi:hypothetical protein [Sphingomonas sp.]|uniref:hypothetical protein n=1 Tax=Sphingomonas sp. TaxID=28214 RepID=UPI003F718232